MHLNPALLKPDSRFIALGITNASGLSVGYLKRQTKINKAVSISIGKSIYGTVDYNQKECMQCSTENMKFCFIKTCYGNYIPGSDSNNNRPIPVVAVFPME
jgi:hypothetical protein